MSNRLIHEQSPYLLQHAHNPVDWYPWGPEALARARAEDKPILVSIGYSACHWCHVMERESFEDPEIARLMNDHFINIKVDREERPDVDGVYMEAVQALTGHGGWPLNVFLTPDTRPFYGGTYFPPQSRHGLPGWSQVLEGVAETYRARRDDVAHNAEALTAYINRAQARQADAGDLTADTMSLAYEAAEREFDWTEGGFGTAPKFPQPLALDLVLRLSYRLDNPRGLEFALLTLGKMAAGGIHDQLGGGFHRYSVDGVWLVPHFEKMLYDNALLARVYLHAYQWTQDGQWAEICQRTLDYLLRDMRGPHGAFYAAEDADSDGEEGKFYVWTWEEFESLLGADLAGIAAEYFGVTPRGNFEGRTILTRARSVASIAQGRGREIADTQGAIAGAASLLFTEREKRPRPAKDTKVLAGWNGLAIRTLAEAGRVLRREDYISEARRAMDFILVQMRPDGRLVRSFREQPASIPAMLEDYALIVEALISLYESALDLRYLEEARRMARQMIDSFWDPSASAFFDVGIGHDLLVRPRSIFDNPLPAGNSAAAFALLRLGALTEEDELVRYAEAIFQGAHDILRRAPLAVPYLCSALDFLLSGALQIALVGPTVDSLREFMDAAFSDYLPNRVLAVGPADEPALVRGRQSIDGLPTAYVCRQFTCQLPVTNVDALLAQLRSQGGEHLTE